ncbi:putative two-component sensor kinase [Streptomyces ambofaciens ATCC 23877]|uniref:histidine kinase n=1 Tax=Streptomyces ambofaciens (strain ATCC 23877 / 3486 / DSM 40053 / JCM 4204 / NBRC 12836 / NRRL B-2516) TaxID=278992 RepID=A0A0K2AUX0_STRA7|nr:histidine kinase [Streptomyces ambofaciens]AKZ56607.1 putative two-component sensor kinase [Streptomyces ambofaciens ATCC 23877]
MEPVEPLPLDRAAEPLTEYVQRVTRRVRAFDRRRPLVWDLLLTGFWVLAALIDAAGGWRNVAHDPDVPAALVLALSLALTVPLLWRRAHPGAALLVSMPAALVSSWSGAALQAALLQLLLVHHIALRLPLRTLWWAVALVTAPTCVAVARYGDSAGSWNQQLGSHLLSVGVAVLIGVTVRTRRDYTEVLEDRARRLETERDQQLRLAAAAERARIAREMHDIIGHNLSVITGLADGGRYAAAKSPERAAQALDAIGTTSRQALGELRRLLDVLRDEDRTDRAELAPQPALTDLDRLLTGVRGAGLPVRTTVQGRATLPEGRQLTVYRVIQEALTNTLKHAGPDATAHIDLSYEAGGAVALTVTDTGRGGPPPAASEGRGLPGMRERTSLYGGTLEAGPRPRPERGWRVHLRLPEESAQ